MTVTASALTRISTGCRCGCVRCRGGAVGWRGTGDVL